LLKINRQLAVIFECGLGARYDVRIRVRPALPIRPPAATIATTTGISIALRKVNCPKRLMTIFIISPTMTLTHLFLARGLLCFVF
jgi:hypothetical protein